LEITYEELGKGDHIVIIFPSFSMGSHVCSSAADPTPGWWEGMVGPNKAIDTNKFRVICASILGAPFGTTSPISIDPKTNKIYGPRFPTITTNDQARVHIKLLDYLGVKSVHAAIGSSLGGMQVLNFAAEMENKLDRFVALCCTGKSSPGTVALRRVQRLAIASDLEFKNGDYEKGKGPFSGLAIARELGTICYRSRDEFDKRFNWNPQAPFSPQSLSFEVEKYLAAQAARFNVHYDANCYMTLSRCMDLMDLGRGSLTYAAGVKRIKAKSYLIGFEKDMLIPIREMEHLACLLGASTTSVLETHPSVFGHDAFLKEYDWLTPRIQKFLNPNH